MPRARLKSLLGSSSTSYSQPLPSTRGFTLLMFCAWSMLTAKIFTPVSSCQSAYTSLMAESSRLHGLHHVAKKSMMKGLPLFDKVSVRTVLPLMSLRVTDGRVCAPATPATASRADRHIILRNFIRCYTSWFTIFG